jgi:excisionase family DNA binding protein
VAGRILQELHQQHHRQELHPMSASMLTAQQVQDLLDVDASTVYRMAGDGRLPAVRIGRQWRFPADAIERLLVPAGAAGHGQPATEGSPALPVDLATSLLDTVAHALGVTMVVTDLGGRALTPVVNPAPALVQLLDDPAFTAACTVEWRGFAHEPHLAPRLQLGQHGFLCAHSLVRRGTSLVAMVLAGGIAPECSDDPDLFHLDTDARRRVLETLPRTAALLSRLVATSTAG